MNLENEAYFKNVYPKLLAKENARHEDFWGFECADGWFNLLNLLMQNIQSHCDWKQDTCPQVIVKQVKEKFGTLRFYYEGGDEYVAGLVALAESMSGIMCEGCGAPAKTSGGLNGKGWIKTMCQTCNEKRGKNED